MPAVSATEAANNKSAEEHRSSIACHRPQDKGASVYELREREIERDRERKIERNRDRDKEREEGRDGERERERQRVGS